jgi:hypothetical protein
MTTAVTPEALEKAKQVLEHLEEQAIEYSSLDLPAQIAVELDDQKKGGRDAVLQQLSYADPACDHPRMHAPIRHRSHPREPQLPVVKDSLAVLDNRGRSLAPGSSWISVWCSPVTM